MNKVTQIKDPKKSDGVIVLGKLSMPGHPTNWDNSRAKAYCACSKSGRGFLDIFLLSVIFLFFLALRLKYCLNRQLNRKQQTTNQPIEV